MLETLANLDDVLDTKLEDLIKESDTAPRNLSSIVTNTLPSKRLNLINYYFPDIFFFCKKNRIRYSLVHSEGCFLLRFEKLGE